MNIVILAAGFGTRLGLATGEPKCLVKLAGHSLLEHQLELYRSYEARVSIVLRDGTQDWFEPWPEVGHIVVPAEGTSNMVESLSYVPPYMDDGDTVVSYGDIVFEEGPLAALMRTDAGLAVAVDYHWHRLWSFRMEQPLEDCEAIEILDGYVTSIGGKAESTADVPAQYMGLLKFSPQDLHRFLAFYWDMCRTRPAYGDASMTTVLNDIAASGHRVTAVGVKGGWLEVDSKEDLARYREAVDAGTLDRFWKPVGLRPSTRWSDA